MPFTPLDADYQERIRASFGRQRVMNTIGAAMVHLGPGEVDLEMAMKPEWGQQYGFMHAGIVSTLLDSSCGYAAFSLMAADTAVLSVEFKVNLLRPAAGEKLIARGRVVKPGKSITFCEGRAFAVEKGVESLVATMSTTVIALPERKDLQEVPGRA